MEILDGLYRTDCKYITKDNFGGNPFDVYAYTYIYIYDERIYYFGIDGYSMNFDDRPKLKEFYKRIFDYAYYAIKKSYTENYIEIFLNNNIYIYGYMIDEKHFLLSGKDEKNNLFMDNIIFEKQDNDIVELMNQWILQRK